MKEPIDVIKDAYHDDIQNWSNPGNQDKVNIALGLLSSEKTEKLTQAIIDLQKQIPLTVSELRSTISSSTDKIIDSNQKLSTSTEKYAVAMNWLTFGLVIIGIVQVIVSFIKSTSPTP